MGLLYLFYISRMEKQIFKPFFVKLHSELALPTELQLDRAGVDFVFPPSQTSNK